MLVALHVPSITLPATLLCGVRAIHRRVCCVLGADTLYPRCILLTCSHFLLLPLLNPHTMNPVSHGIYLYELWTGLYMLDPVEKAAFSM